MANALQPDWLAMIEDRRAVELAESAGAVLGIPIPPEEFLDECVKTEASRTTRGRLGCPSKDVRWTDAAWATWLKTRAINCGAYDQGGEPELPQWTSCVLHVGFVGVVESEWNLFLLKQSSKKEGQAQRDTVARSKLAKSLYALRAIDRVAARVFWTKGRDPESRQTNEHPGAWKSSSIRCGSGHEPVWVL